MRFTAFVSLLIVGAAPAVAKECRMPDVPQGVRVQLPPECRDSARMREPTLTNRDYLKAEEGFVDLGNGTRVRIGGRARAEMGIRP